MRVTVPGKAMLAGEYAVLAGAPGIVCAVDRFLTVDVAKVPSDRLQGAGQAWHQGEEALPALAFALQALQVATAYLKGKGRARPGLSLELTDALRAPDGTKLGLGGSACTCVGVTAAVLASAGLPLDRALVFKLAATAHAAGQQTRGSALDVAASTYGGTLFTRRFEVEPLLGLLKAGGLAFATVVDCTAAPEVERLPSPGGLGLAFSGSAASTAALVSEMEKFGAAKPKIFATFVAKTSHAVDTLRRALLAKDHEATLRAFESAGHELEVLGEASGLPLVSDAHREIAALARSHGAAAKISGAGGGDCCVIAGATGALHDALRDAKIHSLEVQVPEAGVALLAG